MVDALLALAALADALTMLALPAGAEMNPIAAAYPVPAVLAKAVLVLLILVAPLGRYARDVRLFGVGAWTTGALSNVAVLLAS